MTRKPPSAITPITGSMLYDMIQCEHRPYMDVFANPALRASPDPFVELLWEAGQTQEEDVIASSRSSLLGQGVAEEVEV